MNLIYTQLDDFLRALLREDIGTGDITSESCIPEDVNAIGRFIAKESGIICGLDIAVQLFELVDKSVIFEPIKNDGDLVNKGDIIANISGPAISILIGERTAINLMGHLSGVATKTAEYVKLVQGTKAKILDTRKTTPGLRVLEKYAVRSGGGTNHRYNLSDGILIKDNHIKAAGGITNAVAKVREKNVNNLKIEVETESLEEVKEALEAGVDIIMLDNMTTDMMAEAVKFIDGRAATEASGNMGDLGSRDLLEVAKTGVDFISIGALTHSVKTFDISLILD